MNNNRFTLAPGLLSEDILVVLKMSSWNQKIWDLEFLSEELGMTVEHVKDSLERLNHSGLIQTSSRIIQYQELKEFMLHGLPYFYPTRHGELTVGMLTGAKDDKFFTTGLPYTSTSVWPNPNGKEKGFAIEPLSDKCCFAALNDSRLRQLLAISETLRIVGKNARDWARKELDLFYSEII